MIEKQEEAYKSISEVAKILNLVNQKTGKINTFRKFLIPNPTPIIQCE